MITLKEQIYAKPMILAMFVYPLWRLIIHFASFDEPTFSRVIPTLIFFLFYTSYKSKSPIMSVERFWVIGISALIVDYHYVIYDLSAKGADKLFNVYFIGSIVIASAVILLTQNRRKLIYLVSLLIFSNVTAFSMIYAHYIDFFNEHNGFMSVGLYLTSLLVLSLGSIYKISIEETLMKRLQDAEIKNINDARILSLGEMSGGIAHEINNPLQILSGNIEILEQDLSPEEKSKVIDSSHNTILRINSIIKNLRKFSSKKESQNFEKFDLNESLDLSLELFNQKFESYKISVEKNSNPHLMISGIKSEINQVLYNLIKNSFEAILEKKSVSGKIKIYMYENMDSVVFEISDSGKDFDKLNLDKLGQPFFTTKPIGSGVGLGLSTSMGILKSHKGQITFNPNPKKIKIEIPKFNT